MANKRLFILITTIFYIQLCSSMEPVVVVHGGAGDISDDKIPAKIAGVKFAATEGYRVLQLGGSVVDAVEAAIRTMEDDPAFNCGYGSVLNAAGEVEMDSSIMIGSNLSAGAVCALKDIKNPISLARMVMERTPHILLAADGAKQFAQDQGVPILPPGALIPPKIQEAIKKQEYRPQQGETEVDTVGCVALDAVGLIAAGTSTGGTSGKMVGRVGDSPQLGSGTYADDSWGGVSVTGHGESIAKVCLSYSIINGLESGKNASHSAMDAITRMTERLNNTAGAVLISSVTGEVGYAFSSRRMAWAYQIKNEIHFGIEQGEHLIEIVP